MKILQFINSLSPGGAEKLLVDSLLKYHDKGLEIDLLLLRGGPSPFLKKLEMQPEIKIMSLGENINIYNPKHILKLNSYFNNYDIVHVHLFPALYWASMAKLLSNKKYKLVFTEHNVENRRRKKFYFKLLDRIIYKNFDKIATISDSVDESLQKYIGSSFTNITKIYNGIDLKEINKALPYTKTDLNLPENCTILLQVSSFSAQKNQQALIRSLKHLSNDIILLLVGSGDLRNECELLVNELGLSDRVHFFGVRSDVPKLLKTADVVILSSHYEGLSLSSVEGLASGKPFIASDVPGLKEVVSGAGILFPDDKDEILASQIKKLITDKEYYKLIAKKGGIRAQNFDIENMVNNYIVLFKDCLR